MDTRTVPEGEWVTFFDDFSRSHLGWIATIEVLDRETGPMKVADGIPLQGISFDTRGSRACAIDVGVGDETGRHVHHVVDMPLYIREAYEPGGAVDLQIEPARGPVTLIHLRGPVH
jgi:hypothetical protein